MNNDNLQLLIFNALLYILTFLLHQKIKRYWGVSSLILLLYVFVSLVGIDLFFHPYSEYKNLSLFPFIYLYSMLMIVAYPILSINEKNVKEIQEPSKLLIDSLAWFVIIITIISSIPYVLKINNILDNFLNGSEFIRSAYNDTRDTVDQRGDNNFDIFGILGNMVMNLCPMLFFYYLSRYKVNKKIIIGLAVSFVLSLLPSLSQSARGTLGQTILIVFFLYLFFKNQITNKVKRIIRVIMVVILLIIFIPFAVITIARFDEKNSRGPNLMNYYIEYYIGQSFLNFNNYGLDAGGSRHGDRTATLFKQTLGFKTANNYEKRREKYENMKMDESIFSTYVGDFTLDYGPYVSTSIFIFLYAIFSRKLKMEDKCTFSQFILYYILYTVCIGIFLFPYSDLGGNLKIIFYIMLYFIFQYDYKRFHMEK